MKDFKKQSFGGGNRFNKPSYPRNNYGNDRGEGFGRPELFETTCAHCNKRCEVPFRPNGKKPVYCKECFGGNDSGAEKPFVKREFSNDRAERPQFAPKPDMGRDTRIDDLKRQVEAISIKLDRLLEATVPQKREAAAPAAKAAVAAPAKAPAAKKAAAPKKAVKKAVAKKKTAAKKK